MIVCIIKLHYMDYNLKILQLLERVYLLWKYILIDISMVCTMIYMGKTSLWELAGLLGRTISCFGTQS